MINSSVRGSVLIVLYLRKDHKSMQVKATVIIVWIPMELIWKIGLGLMFPTAEFLNFSSAQSWNWTSVLHYKDDQFCKLETHFCGFPPVQPSMPANRSGANCWHIWTKWHHPQVQIRISKVKLDRQTSTFQSYMTPPVGLAHQYFGCLNRCRIWLSIPAPITTYFLP